MTTMHEVVIVYSIVWTSFVRWCNFFVGQFGEKSSADVHTVYRKEISKTQGYALVMISQKIRFFVQPLCGFSNSSYDNK